MTEDSKPVRKAGKHDPTWLGWAARLISLALLCALVIVIAMQIARPPSPPRFVAEVAVEDIREDDGRWMIPVEIRNEGTRTAQAVSLEIDAGGETSEISIPMIGEAETVTFVVPAPAPVTAVTMEVQSYEAP